MGDVSQRMWDAAIDFDGTIMDPGTLSEKEGAVDALHSLLERGVSFYVLTARKDLLGAMTWLSRHGLDNILVTNTKYPARVYVDDRGYKFENWDDALEVITGR